MLRRTGKEIVRMLNDELIHGAASGNQNGETLSMRRPPSCLRSWACHVSSVMMDVFEWISQMILIRFLDDQIILNMNTTDYALGRRASHQVEEKARGPLQPFPEHLQVILDTNFSDF